MVSSASTVRDTEPKRHLLKAGEPPSSGTATPTRPQNLRHKICPACKMSWGDVGTELVGVDNP